MSLADLIIEHGPYLAGDLLPEWKRLTAAADHNALRDELIELRRLRAAAETRLNGPMVARLRTCAADTSPNWDGRITIYPPEARELVNLIDLVRRADEHAEECR